MVRAVLTAAATVAVVAADPFGDFKAKFGRHYDGAEHDRRKEIFAANLEFIERENAKGHSYHLVVNEFTDMTQEEYRQRLGYRGKPTADSKVNLGTHTYAGETLEDEIDWVKNGAVTPVKDQGQCGSCWAFSTTGSLEGAWKQASGKLVSLSEEQLVDCSKENNGCSGGLMDQGFDFLKKAGSCTEKSYPYTAGGECKSSCDLAVPAGALSGHIDVESTEESLMSALAKGPVSVAIEADQAAFSAYGGGVLTGTCGDALDHGVLVVGYGEDAGQKYWKVKNSWGASWGENGYIRLERGMGGKGQCGILSEPSYPVVHSAAVATTPVEKPKYATGFKLGSIFESNAPIEVAEITQEMRDSAPAKLDWTTTGATTAVKDQGQCGSCWAFSVTETVESAVHLATKQAPPVLAPQQLTSCDTAEDKGCQGGNPVNAYAYLEKVGGLDVEADYPYTSGKSQESGTCQWSGKKVAKVTDWKFAVPPCQSGDCSNQDEDGLKAMLNAHGPLSIVVNANPWQTYQSGVLDAECAGAMDNLDHAVQLVGYDTTASPPYWKVRNSWATVWGEEGYIRLPMGKNSCGMANLVTYVTASLVEANATSIMV